MAKQSGLGDQLFVGGYDLSGDISAVQSLKDMCAVFDVTGIDKSATERIYGRRDGEIGLNCFYNPGLLREHVVFKPLPQSDVETAYFHGSTIGNMAACMLSKLVTYDWNRGADGSLLGNIMAKLTGGAGLEWCEQLTAGKRTDTAATNGAALDGGTRGTAMNITSVGVANPGQVNVTAHGLVTGDTVVIAGTTTTPAINSEYVVTVVNANQFTIPVNVTSGQAGAAGTATKTSTNYGLAAYLHAFAFTGTDVTVKLQHSADNSSWADVTAGGFTQLTSAPGAQRIETGLTATIRRYLRAVTTTSAGVTSVTFAVAVVRYTGPRDP